MTIDGKPFELAIRYRQERKPFDVLLKDVEKMNYSGTDTARDYSSQLVITDRETGESQEGKTWMNNPIRYKGETFYQSRYNKIPTPGGGVVETTGLQVVENMGWVIPYVACMMVFWGMFAHFGGTFLTFANRYARGAIPTSNHACAPMTARELDQSRGDDGYRLGDVCAGRWLFRQTRIAQPRADRLCGGGRIPVQHEGRIKPFDSVARNMLQFISKPMFGSMPYVKDSKGEQALAQRMAAGGHGGAGVGARCAGSFASMPDEVRDRV